MKRTNSQSGARRRYYTRYLAHYTKKNYRMLLLGGLFVLGVALGTLLVRYAGRDTVELLLRLIGDTAQRRRSQGFTANLLAGGLSGLGIVAGLFVCGLCAVAQPAELLAPLVRGLGFGFSAASLYARFGPGAAGFVGVFMVPGMVVTTIAMLFCCNEALRMSGSLWGMLRGGESEAFARRVYAARFIAAAALWFAGVFVEAALYALLPGAFVLA